MHGRGIRAARDRARDTADFQTNGRCFCSHNTSAPQNGIFIQTPQGLARRGFKNQNPARGRSVPPASPARAGEGDCVSGGGGALNASYKPSIASEVHARHKRPHRLALLATSPVATGEAKQEEPRKGTETQPVLTKTDSGLYFKTISPQGDGAYLQPPLPERGRGTA